MRWWEQLDAPVLGRYRIDRLLGEGGMARVFLATDVRADRPVAFKTPKIESFPPESVNELLSRFSREFRAQASDPIQGVIPIYESGEFTDDDGVVRPFLAMQYLPGGSLGDALGGDIGRRVHRQTLGEVLDWLVPIARTIDRLHARKYLHRDIKPDNILFNSDGDPFLADLGIVGSLDPALGGTAMGSTALGVLGSPGSPGYQSPESIQADPALRNITASDQFSLAVTVYEALAGKLPMAASTNQAWYGALMHWSPTPLSVPCPDLPAAASDAVMKAMDAQASGRFVSCSEFAKSLVAAAGEAPVIPEASLTPSPASPPIDAARVRPAAPAPERRAPMSMLTKARIGSAVMAVVVLGTGLALGWNISTPPPGDSSVVSNAATAIATTATGTTDQDAGAGVPLTGLEAQLQDAGMDCRSDTDGDGVHDCIDLCLATVRGAPVGKDGCARTSAFALRTLEFEPGQIDLTEAHKLALDEASVFLQAHPASRVEVAGHADSAEGHGLAGELRLSKGRANTVLEYLVVKGVQRRRLQAADLGVTGQLKFEMKTGGAPESEDMAKRRHVVALTSDRIVELVELDP